MTRATGLLVTVVLMAACGGSMRAPSIAPAGDVNATVVRVRTALLNDPGVHGNEITVSENNGVIVLTGQVHGTREADAAMAIARRSSDGKEVRNEMRTDRP